jgi:hypothetical protein
MRVSPAQMSTKAITRWVVVLTAIGSLMAALDTLVVSTALNTIRLDLGASIEQLEWVVLAPENAVFPSMFPPPKRPANRGGRYLARHSPHWEAERAWEQIPCVALRADQLFRCG